MTGEKRGHFKLPAVISAAPVAGPTSGSDQGNTDDHLHFGPFRLIRAERLLVRDGSPVPIGGRAFDLLLTLANRAGEVISSRELNSLVWPGVIVEEANLRVCIAALRKALGDSKSCPRYILNVAGRGYTFIAPIQRVSGDPRLAPAAPLGAKRSRSSATLARLLVSRNDTGDILSRLRASRRFANLVEADDSAGRNAVVSPLADMLREQSGSEALCFAYLGTLPGQADGVRNPRPLPAGVRDRDPVHQARAFLAGKRILVVLDRCRHVIGTATSLYDRLFHAASSVHFLTTSRDALRLESENMHSDMPHAEPPAETQSLVEALRAIDVTAFTYGRWRREFGGLTSDGMRRLEYLEKENQRLRRAIADLTLEAMVLKENSLGL